jgi:LPXTG-site transpeptidase (sortase) family protein
MSDMSQQKSSGDKKETAALASLFLIAIGGFCLLAAVVAWAASPPSLPHLLELAVVPTAAPTANLPAVPPTYTPPHNLSDQAILLPETPLTGGLAELPSQARLADAPQLAAVREAPPGHPIRLQIPRLELDAPVMAVNLEQIVVQEQVYYQWRVPAGYMAGWHNDSALLGQPGNTVLNGHHNIYGQLFRNLADLEVGDEIVAYDGERPFTYRVEQILILPERGEPVENRLANAQWIAPTADERLTLVSCWPFYDNSHRLIVIARPSVVE